MSNFKPYKPKNRQKKLKKLKIKRENIQIRKWIKSKNQKIWFKAIFRMKIIGKLLNEMVIKFVKLLKI